ncbi:MAG: hypothetical protein IID44_05875 [Planctomycetes bacterium]|nr:hypothetical protein [Planctomycetota bacterium]
MWIVAGGTVDGALRDGRGPGLIGRVSGLDSMLPVAAFYSLVVFFTRYSSWHGVWSLYEQYVFLVPVPFLSM